MLEICAEPQRGNIMADIRSKVNWDEVKESLKKKYPLLTDGDFEEEKEDKLLIQLGEKLGKTKEEIKHIILKL